MTNLFSVVAFAALAVLTYAQLAQAKVNPCSLKPDSGPCDGSFKRWFFNKNTKKCESFIWGGCQGTVPFKTLAACNSAKCAACTQVPATGPCRALFTKWFFNNDKGKCQKFTWGGCGGSVPFDTKQECKKAKCVPTMLPKPKPPSLQARCDLRPDAGPCRARKRRWFWDAKKMKCTEFFWGGCFGTVPFKTKKKCLKAKCKNRCRFKPDPGPCRGSFVRYFYDPKNDSCEKFTWGGCLGLVPFETKEDCDAAGCVKDRCKLKPDPGPCKAKFTRWFYNSKTDICQSFTWGGCKGVVPFETESECASSKCVKNRCKLKPDMGPCEAAIPRYFWDIDAGECKRFLWGGCQGIVPFQTKEACIKAKCKNRCELKPDPGPCRGSFKRWFYNPRTEMCEPFTYGGCLGVVPFQTEKECEDANCKPDSCGGKSPCLSSA